MTIPSSKPSSLTVEDLMLEMDLFRDRKVLQIQGSPTHALSALVQKSSFQKSALFSAPLAKIHLKKWMAHALKVPFGVIALCYKPALEMVQGLNDWNTDLNRRQNRHQNSMKSERVRQAIQEIDQKLLNRVYNLSYISSPIDTREMGQEDHALVEFGPHVYRPTRNKAEIRTLGNAQGQIDSFLETTQNSSTLKTFSRWFTLLHEAAHVEYLKLNHPFTPKNANEILSEESVAAFNRQIFSPLNNHPARSILDECFADCYGAMVLLEISGHHLDALETIHLIKEERAALRLKDEKEDEADYIRGSDMLGVREHTTDFALHRMLKDKANWKGKSPTDLKILAAQYSSDGFMDIVDLNRVAGKSHYSAGKYARWDAFTIDQSELLNVVSSFFSLRVEGENIQEALQTFDQTHPKTILMASIWKHLEDYVEDYLKDALSDVEEVGGKPGKQKKLDHLENYWEINQEKVLRHPDIQSAILHHKSVALQDLALIDLARHEQQPSLLQQKLKHHSLNTENKSKIAGPC